MGLFNWLWDVSTRHYSGINRYEKGKISTRIITLIIMLVFAALALFLEYWTIKLFQENFIVGILMIILTVGIFGGTIEFCAVYSFVGFKMFFVGTVGNMIKKREKKKKAKVAAESEIIENPEIVQTAPQEGEQKEKKSHHWLDLVVAILGIVVIVATVAVGIYILASING